MNRLRENEKETESPKKRKGFSAGVNSLLSGEFLTREGVTKHLPFMLFLALLFVLNISWVYYSENTFRDLQKARRELEELQSEYNTVSSQLEKKKRQSRVALDTEDLGLKESTSPPLRIEVPEGYFDE
jgi:hypothetical protein